MTMRKRENGIVGLMVLALVSCRPHDVLSVPAPAGVLASGALQNQTGAEGAFNAAKAQLFNAADGAPLNVALSGNVGGGGLLLWSGLLADEFTFAAFSRIAPDANIDARTTTGGGGFLELGDVPWQNLLQARSGLLAAIPGLVAYEPANGRSKVGEAYALAGYAELLVAEAYCAGTPLDRVLPGVGIQYGTPLTTDSLLGVAETHFDSAVADANGNAMVTGLASVGLGRVRLDRGQYAAAATATPGVPTSFVYNVELESNTSAGTAQGSNPYANGIQFNLQRLFNVADGEGGNGLNFVSAHDPRLAFDTTYQTTDGVYGGVVPGTWYLPKKFEVNLSDIPLAMGIEARLIEAEAALKANNPAGWLADLNALRNSGCTVPGVDSTCTLGMGQVPSQTTGLASLSDPGTDSGRVSLMFRERAFWLFGTGTRLGDLRRLIRQYGRDQATVFPMGPYANGHNPFLPVPIPTYGTDVNLTLPTPDGLSLPNGGSNTVTNPNYKGCITSTKTA